MVQSKKKKKRGEYGATDGRRQSKRGALSLLYFNTEFLQSILSEGLIQSRGECCWWRWPCISSHCLLLGRYSLPGGNLCLENPQILHAHLGYTSTVPFSLTLFAVVIILLFRLQRQFIKFDNFLIGHHSTVTTIQLGRGGFEPWLRDSWCAAEERCLPDHPREGVGGRDHPPAPAAPGGHETYNCHISP